MFILSLLFPPRCFGCGRIGNYFCQRCSLVLPAGRQGVRSIELNQMICPVCQKLAVDGITHPRCQGRGTPDGLISIFQYRGAIQKAIKNIKYRYIRDAAKSIINLIPPTSYNFIGRELVREDTILIPIPLHAKRFRERGFNQSEILGKFFSDKFKISMDSKILKRVKHTTPQVEMKSRKERLKNMEGVFSVSHLNTRPYIRNNLILFDDVYTTGGTLLSATKALKQAGFKSIWCVTIAR